jgi:hypothetical protein
MALVAVALLAGTALGVGGTWLSAAFGPREPAGQSAGTGRAVPSFTGTLPTSGPPRTYDPSIAPEVTALIDRGSAIELRWTDRSGGQASFVIVIEVAGATASTLLQVDAGRTAVVVNGLDPKAARYCFYVIAITRAAQARSPDRCTTARR